MDTVQDNEHAPFLFTDGHLGIPEKKLYKCCLAALEVLAIFRSKVLSPANLSDTERSQAHYSTSVVLLALPDHQTALHFRIKLHFEMYQSDSGKIENELAFIAALFTVKQCAKVSSLWHYRRFLLSTHVSAVRHAASNNNIIDDELQVVDRDIDDTFTITTFQPISLKAEMNVITRAIETYPRNYFAWHHRVLCLKSVIHTIQTQAIQSDSGYLAFLSDELKWIRGYIQTNVSDYSAVSYLMHVTEGFLRYFSEAEHDYTIVKDNREQALDLIQRYPAHESLWLFMRQVIRDPSFNSSGVSENDIAVVRRVLAESAAKCMRQIEDVKGEAHVTIRHGVKFFLWLRSMVSEASPNIRTTRN